MFAEAVSLWAFNGVAFVETPADMATVNLEDRKLRLGCSEVEEFQDGALRSQSGTLKSLARLPDF